MEIQSVNQITLFIKQLLENSEQLSDIWIEGEVSNFKRAASGHCYFILKDDESELRCAMWRMQALHLDWEPTQGDWVEAHGYVSVYERGGYYQFYVNLLQKSGIGRLWQQFLQLKEKLDAEGLFAEERKRPLPAWPKQIGVVTSPTGAALQDIINVMRARFPIVSLVVSPAMVQGVEAPKSIIRALNVLNNTPDIDVIIIARGGGSLEDLWAFNDEGVARAVAASRIPVISGVGHETDFTICDFVADVRAPTPTAAAAAVVPDGAILLRQLVETRQAISYSTGQCLDRLRDVIEREQRALTVHHPRRRIDEMRQRLDAYRHQMEGRVTVQLGNHRQLLASTRMRLEALETRHVLERGFAIVRDTNTGMHLNSTAKMVDNQQVTIILADGHAQSRIEKVTLGGNSFNEKDRSA